MNTIQTINKTIKLCIQLAPKISIINHLFHFLTDFFLLKKMSNNGKWSEKCDWDNEGSVFCIKWYNGRDSHGYFSNNAIFNIKI
jgi:hypothetical protein